ncbi:MAG: acyltransferase family protein [Chloroflexaceae bacterium]|nr:acyltransferase family protein [Chloroflexaceae bacterium]
MVTSSLPGVQTQPDASTIAARNVQKIRYIDILRVMVAFAVVCSHATASALSEIDDINSFNWWIVIFIKAFVCCTPPIFVMISGSLFLEPAKDVSPTQFFRKRARRLLIPIIFWSVVFFVARASRDELTLQQILSDIFYGRPYDHLWYLYMLPGLYLFTPSLRTFLKSASRDDMRYLIVAIFSLDVLVWISGFFVPFQENIFTMFLRYLGYYVCGYYLVASIPRRFASVRYFSSIW